MKNLWCKLSDDGDNPTYIFNKPRVGYRMPRVKRLNWKRGEVEAFPHPSWQALVRRGENPGQPRGPRRRSTQKFLILSSLVDGHGAPRVASFEEPPQGVAAGHAEILGCLPTPVQGRVSAHVVPDRPLKARSGLHRAVQRLGS